jgi:hypothetical protein
MVASDGCRPAADTNETPSAFATSSAAFFDKLTAFRPQQLRLIKHSLQARAINHQSAYNRWL